MLPLCYLHFTSSNKSKSDTRKFQTHVKKHDVIQTYENTSSTRNSTPGVWKPFFLGCQTFFGCLNSSNFLMLNLFRVSGNVMCLKTCCVSCHGRVFGCLKMDILVCWTYFSCLKNLMYVSLPEQIISQTRRVQQQNTFIFQSSGKTFSNKKEKFQTPRNKSCMTASLLGCLRARTAWTLCFSQHRPWTDASRIDARVKMTCQGRQLVRTRWCELERFCVR